MSERDPQHEFERHFMLCEQQLFGYILSMVPRHSDALDLLQDAAAALWQKFDQYDPARPFAAWARRFAHIQVHKYREQRRYRDWMLAPFDEQVIDVLSAAFESHADVVELRREALVKCLERMTAAEHDLLHHRYWEETNMRSLAETMGISEHQIYRRLQRIRGLLQECIDEQVGEIEA